MNGDIKSIDITYKDIADIISMLVDPIDQLSYTMTVQELLSFLVDIENSKKEVNNVKR